MHLPIVSKNADCIKTLNTIGQCVKIIGVPFLNKHIEKGIPIFDIHKYKYSEFAVPHCWYGFGCGFDSIGI